MAKKTERRRVDLPHNTEAEKAVLGAMIRSNTIFMDYIYKLDVEDFYEENENHRVIFAAMQKLNKDGIPVDSQTITNELINANKLEVSGAPEYLIELADSIITFENIETYFQIVVDQALLRRFIITLGDINNEYYTKEIASVSDFLTDAEKRLNSITEKRRTSDFQSSKVISDELSKEFEVLKATDNDEAVTGTPTGFPRLNVLTHGFQKGEMIILAARPGVGKTALSLNLAFNAAKLNYPVAYFSLEMPAKTLFKRLVSADANVKFDSLLTGFGVNQHTRLNLQQSCERLSKFNIYIDDTSGIKLPDLVAKCRKLKKEVPDLSLIVVDYIGLITTNIKSKNESRQLEVQMISQTLKKLALELEVPVLGVAQLNRNVESRGGEPQLSDLRESGSLEQDADIVLMLHESKLGDSSNDGKKSIFEKQDEAVLQKQQEIATRDGGPDTKIVNLIIVKNRSGRTGRVPLLFRKDFCKFDSPTRESEQQIRELENERVNYFNRD